MGPDSRVSRPTRKTSPSSTRAVARPRPMTSSGVRSTLARPRTPSVPNLSIRTSRATPRGLALGVLRRLAGLLEAVLLGLLLPRVAGEESSSLEGDAQLGLELGEGAGDTHAQGACLAGDATAVDGAVDVVALTRLGDLQGLDHQHAMRRRR